MSPINTGNENQPNRAGTDAQHDNDVFAEVIKRNEAMINKLAYARKITGMEFADVRQEMLVTLWAACGKYNPEHPGKTAMFETYAYAALENRSKELYRTMHAQARGAGVTPCSLDITLPTDGETSASLLNILPSADMPLDDYVVLQETLDIVNKVIKSMAKPKARAVIRDLISGYSQVEVGRRNNCAQSQVSSYKSSFRKRLAEFHAAHG